MFREVVHTVWMKPFFVFRGKVVYCTNNCVTYCGCFRSCVSIALCGNEGISRMQANIECSEAGGENSYQLSECVCKHRYKLRAAGMAL